MADLFSVFDTEVASNYQIHKQIITTIHEKVPQLFPYIYILYLTWASIRLFTVNPSTYNERHVDGYEGIIFSPASRLIFVEYPASRTPEWDFAMICVPCQILFHFDFSTKWNDVWVFISANWPDFPTIFDDKANVSLCNLKPLTVVPGPNIAAVQAD